MARSNVEDSLNLSQVIPLHAKWILEMDKYLQGRNYLVLNGFNWKPVQCLSKWTKLRAHSSFVVSHKLLKLYYDIVRFLYHRLHYTSVQQKVLLFPLYDSLDFLVVFNLCHNVFFTMLYLQRSSKVPCKRFWKALRIRVE